MTFHPAISITVEAPGILEMHLSPLGRATQMDNLLRDRHLHAAASREVAVEANLLREVGVVVVLLQTKGSSLLAETDLPHRDGAEICLATAETLTVGMTADSSDERRTGVR